MLLQVILIVVCARIPFFQVRMLPVRFPLGRSIQRGVDDFVAIFLLISQRRQQRPRHSYLRAVATLTFIPPPWPEEAVGEVVIPPQPPPPLSCCDSLPRPPTVAAGKEHTETSDREDWKCFCGIRREAGCLTGRVDAGFARVVWTRPLVN